MRSVFIIIILAILESSATSLFDESAIIGVKMKNGDSCIGKTEDRILRMRSYCSYNIYDIVMITCKAKQQSIENTNQNNLADNFLHTIFFIYKF